MSHRLHTPHHVVFARKCFVAAGFANFALEKVLTGYEQTKTPEYLKKNPNGKFPVLETPEGQFIFESNAILRYIARSDESKGLYGANKLENAHVDQWLDWGSGELTLPAFQFFLPHFGYLGNKESALEAEKKLKAALKILDEHLKIHTFLAGDSITIADISIACHLFFGFRFTWDEKARKSIANVTRWFEQVASQEPFKAEFGRLIWCQKALEFPNLPQEESKKEEKKPEKKGEKKAEPKKEEKKPAAKKEEKEEEEEPAEKKEKNPLDSLPPSTFNLFDFKTMFVNAPNKAEPVDFFFKNFDPTGYSIYFIEYQKAEGEGEKVYLTNNLMNGFIQRLDHFRKYAFGVHGVYGDEPKLEIRGVWVWRGEGLPAEITELDSYEYHTFTKLDASKEADKNKITEFWTKLNEDEDVVDGLKARTVKYFK